jgi:translation initiation factor 5
MMTSKEPIRGIDPIDDPFYRYKMQSIVFRTERTKTVISNLFQIANDLKRDPHIMINFIKSKVSSAMKIQGTDVVISNAMNHKKIQEALYEFIEYFVLCPRCRFPESNLEIAEKNINHNCNACGMISSIDSNKNTEKILNQMITNPTKN